MGYEVARNKLDTQYVPVAKRLANPLAGLTHVDVRPEKEKPPTDSVQISSNAHEPKTIQAGGPPQIPPHTGGPFAVNPSAEIGDFGFMLAALPSYDQAEPLSSQDSRDQKALGSL